MMKIRSEKDIKHLRFLEEIKGAINTILSLKTNSDLIQNPILDLGVFFFNLFPNSFYAK